MSQFVVISRGSMKHYIRLVPVLAFFAAGCSDLDGMFAAPRPAPAIVTAVDAPAAPPAPVPAQFCEHVAEDVRVRANAAGFDGASQERLCRQSLQQCAQMAQHG